MTNCDSWRLPGTADYSVDQSLWVCCAKARSSLNGLSLTMINNNYNCKKNFNLIFFFRFPTENCEAGMPETLHAREIVVPHVQLHQVSDQKQLFVSQETIFKK
jgi:hypothetical protein